jgi:hypothetical protein
MNAQRSHELMAVDNAGLRRMQRRDAGERGLHRARGRAVDHREALDAVAAALLKDRLHLGHFGVLGRDNQLAALAMRHAVRGAEFVQQAAAARTVVRAQRAGRVVHAGVDHLAVAGRYAVADAARGFGNDHLMAGERRRACDRKPHHARADDENLHDGVSAFVNEKPRR